VIRARVVAFLQDDLRRQVQRSTAEGVGLVIRDYLGKAKVDNDSVTGAIQHDVRRLQITIHDTAMMHVAQTLKDIGSVKFGGPLRNTYIGAI
jgi:hypothetical protein